MLIYLITGENSVVFVSPVANNVLKFANAIPARSPVGPAVVLAMVILMANRMR
jgi:hypothetical protein